MRSLFLYKHEVEKCPKFRNMLSRNIPRLRKNEEFEILHKGPCKRTRQVPTTPNIVGCCWRTMLRSFAWAQKFDRFQTIRNKCQQVPTLLWFHANGRNKSQHCWAQQCLAVVGQQCWVRLHGPKSLTGFKLYATSANIVVVPCKRTQQVTTLLGPTMLGVVGQQCRVRLHGP